MSDTAEETTVKENIEILPAVGMCQDCTTGQVQQMSEKEQLDAELRAILPYLPGWELDPRYHAHTWCAALIDGTGKGIHVNATQAKGRFYISGMWPTDKKNHRHIPNKTEHIFHHGLSIARNRPPEKIAADLQRRFLPWYTAAYAEQVKRVESHDTTQQRRQEVTLELAALLGKETQLQSDPSHIYVNALTVDIHGTDSVTIQLRYTSLKIAKAVLRAFVKADGLTE